MAFVGSVGTITLGVPDGGEPATTVTVVLTGPDGITTLNPTPVSSDGHLTWTAYPAYTLAGKWVAVWTVNGADLQPQEIYVSALPVPGSVPAWRPELWNVAAYVPRRTLVGAVDGFGVPRRTFDAATFPSSDVVHLLISGACAWTTLTTGPVQEPLSAAALDCAAMRAAGLVEQGYPDNRDDLSAAEALLKLADAMRKDLAAANVALSGDDPSTNVDDLLPEFVFPRACWPGELVW